MGIALFTVGALVAPLHQLWSECSRALLGRAQPGRSRPQSIARSAPRVRVVRVPPVAAGDSRVPRPLRVVRVAEPLRAPANAGRMVISGRMADVCAELDRLAALEAAGPLAACAQGAAPSR
jgi:hypothetical protein